ncbi:ESPR-type extended signal peptide-containing protein [uncultured Veillonella sp.]|uniref:ESPR-type extended signal peptide-containing protein n=3 Tax=Veillonella TaxID=29465 RepID=UPI0025899CCE|nr:ESPR-type extended signal peptide-containing protein [uncultured Veillonella sp.]
MNKVFKVVYSKSKGCYVVVPETAKNNNGKKKVLASVLAGLAVAGVVGGIAPQQAMAGVDTGNSHVNIWADTSPKSNGQNYNVGQNSIVVGYQNTTDNVAGHDGKVAIGAKNTSTNNASTAVGNENKATGGAATAVGAGNTASGKASVALGNVNNADAKAAIAIGTYNNVNYTKGSWQTTPKQAGEYSTVVGNYSSATGTSASAMGVYTNATGAGSFAAGYNNNANGQNSVAIGSENTSHVADTVTLGQFNNAKTMGGISIGKNNLTDSSNDGRNAANTRDENSQIAIGRDNVATHLDTIAIGRETTASGSGSTVVGARAEASGDNSIAIGQSGKGSPKVIASGVNSIAIGMQSQATGEAAIAEGAGSRASGKYGVALGRTTKANAEAATALGNAAEANIANGVALGSSSVTTTDKGVLGYNPSDLHERKYDKLTGNVQTATTAAVSIGNGKQLTRQLTGLAAGTADTDAVNVAQLKNVGVAVTGNTGSSDFLADGGKLNVIGEGRVSTVAAHDGAKDSKITVGFDDKGMVKAGKNVKVDEVTVNGRTTYTIHAADAAAKYDFLTNAKANGGKLDGTATPTKVESGTTVSYAAGKNLTVKQDINQSAGEQTYTYSLNKDLKEITSITNNGGTTMNFGPNNISITGGNLDLGDNNITNLKSGGNVINNAANIGDVIRISKANDLHIAPTAGTNNNVTEYTVDANKKVTLTYQDGNGKTVNGPKAVIDLSGLKTGDMSSFNVKSSATEGKVAQGSAGVQEIRDGKTVEMQAGKNMTIKQTNKNGNAAVEFALNKDIDLTPDGSIKIGDTNITDNGLTINGGPSITKTGINAGGLNITNVKAGVNDNDAVNVSQLKQVRADERHIKPGEYAVDANGKVTMTYLDGNNKDVANETAVITGIAKQDLSNINKGGETVIQNLAKKSIDMENGKNTKVSNREINGVKTFKVDVEGDLNDITSITNKAGDGKIVFGGNQTVNVAGDHNINLNAKVGDITGLTNVTLDAPDFAKKGRAATEEQLKIVNNGFNNTVGLTGNTGATELQKLNKQGGLSFGVVGANNGQYITTTAAGSNVVADLSDSAKNKLNSTVVVEGKNAAKVTSNVIQNADGSTKTVYTVDVNNVKPTAASTEKVQAKADVVGSSDKNIAKVAPKAGENFGDAGATYEVNVSRNDVKDAAREAITVNTSNTTNNPITVTPVQDETNHNTTYTVTFDGNKAATQIPLTYKANGQNAQTVTLDKGLNFTNGRNTTASVDAEGVVKYDVNKDLVNINSISNTTNGPKMEFGPNSINITNGPINMGDQNITNLKSGGDVINNAANIGDVKRISKENDLHIAPTTSNRQGETTTSYAYDAASKSVTLKYNDGNGATQAGTIAKIDLSGLADQIKDGYSFSTDAKGNVVGNHAVTAVGNGKTVSYAAGKNLTVEQDIDATTGEHTYTYALSNNIDLTPNGSLKIGDTIVNNGGLTISGGPSITKTGINAGNLNITNVKAGVNNTDAVNVQQLKDARTLVTSNDNSVTINKTESGNQITYDLHVAPGAAQSVWNVKSSGNTTADSEATAKTITDGKTVEMVAGKNLTVKQTSNNDGAKVEYALSDDIKVGNDGKDGKPGKDGSIGVNGKDGSSVVINGKDGSIGLNGKDGKDGLTMKAENGQPGVNGKDGITRIVYEDKTNTKHEVATLDDGLKFTGNNTDTVNNHKLNSLVKVQGEGVDKTTSATFKSAAGNINVKADGTDTLEVQLNKDLKNITTIKNDGPATLTIGGNEFKFSGGNVNMGDNNITNLKSGGDVINNAANIGDVKRISKENDIHIKDKTYTVNADKTVTLEYVDGNDNTINKTAKIDLSNLPTGDKAAVESVVKKSAAAGDTNIADITVADGKQTGDANAKYEVNVSRNAVKDAAREAVTVNTTNTTNNPITVTPVQDETNHNTTYQVTFDGNKAATQIPLTYKANGQNAQTVTLDKGLNFTNGSNTTASVAADGVVKYDLNNNVDLTPSGSLTIGATVVNNAGLTINNGPSITHTGINAGNLNITNVKAGVNNTDAVNVQQLKDARTLVTSNDNSVTINKTESGNQITYDLHVAPGAAQSVWNVKSSGNTTADSEATAKTITDGKTVEMVAGKNLTVKQTSNNDGAKVEYALSDDIKVGNDGKDGKPGKDGSIGVNGKDGSSVVINGKDGSIGLNGKDGKDGLTMKAENGQPGVNGKDGITRIVYEDKTNTKHEVATLDDGLKFTGNNTDTVNNHKLNSLVKVQGEGVDKTTSATFKSAAGNINVKADGTDTLEVQLNKDLKNITTIKNDGPATLTIGGNEFKFSGGNVNMGDNNITNLKSGGDVINNAANIGDVKRISKANDLHIAPTTSNRDGETTATYAYNTADKSVTLKYNDGNGATQTGTIAKIDLSGLADQIKDGYSFSTDAKGNVVGNHAVTAVGNGKTVSYAAGDNLTIAQHIDNATGEQTYTYALSNDIKVGNDGKDGKPGVDGKIGVNGKDGSSVVINGKDGSIGLNGKDGKDGLTMKAKDGQPGVNGKDGITRIVYEDNSKNTHEVATLDDGMKYAGDDAQGADKSKVIAKKLNETMDVVGGADKSKLTDNNIGVNNVDGRLKVQLSKEVNLTPSGSLTIGDTVVNNNGLTISGGPSITKTGINAGNKIIVNVDAGVNDTDAVNVQQLKKAKTEVKAGNNVTVDTTYGTDGHTIYTVNANDVALGDAVLKYSANGTNTQSVKLSQGLNFVDGNYTSASVDANGQVKYDVTIGKVKDGVDGKPGVDGKDGIATVKTVVDTINNSGWKGDVTGNTVNNHAATIVKPGTTVNFGAGKNLTVEQIVDQVTGNHTYNYALSDDIKVGHDGKDGKPGVDGKIGVNGKDGSSVVINGKDGSIGLNGKDGKDGLTMKAKDGQPGVNGKDGITRIVYEDNSKNTHEVATLDDGMKYAGDDAQGTDKSKVIAKKLNQTMDIVGGANSTKLTDNNIGVNNVDGKLKVQLAQNIDLTPAGSLTIGGTSITDNGLVINQGPSITKGGINAGNQFITNVKAGVNNTDAVNVAQLKSAKTEVEEGDNVKVTSRTGADGQTIYKVSAKAVNLGDAELKYSANGTNTQSVKLSQGLNFVDGNYTTASVDANGQVKYDVTIGKVKDGVDGKPGVDGKDGIATVKTVVDTINNSGWKANATGNVVGNSTATIVKPGNTVNYGAGKNLNVKQTVNGDEQTYEFALDKDLKELNSVQTKNIYLGSPTSHTTITYNNDNSRIEYTTKEGDKKQVANLDDIWTIQANGTDVKPVGGKVNVVGGDHIKVSTDAAGKMTISADGLGTMNGFNVKSTGNTTSDSDKTAKNITDGKTVEFSGGKNLTVKQTNTADGAKVEFALNNNIDLTPNGSVTIGDTVVNNDGLTITGGPTITKNNVDMGGQQIHNVKSGGDVDSNGANIGDIKRISKANDTRIKDGNYEVSQNGTVEMTYVDGAGKQVVDANGNPVKATISGIARQDLSNITNEGKKVITGLSSIVKGGNNVTVDTSVDNTTGQKTYTVNADLSGAKVNASVGADGSGVAKGLKNPVKVEKGTQYIAGDNMVVERKPVEGDDKIDNSITYSLAHDLTEITSISNGGATLRINSNPGSVPGDRAPVTPAFEVHGGNLSLENNRIVNLAPGIAGTDGVNVDQLKGSRTTLTSEDNSVTLNRTDNGQGGYNYDLSVKGVNDPRVNILNEEIGLVGAQGAALSALKPMQYDPMEPTQIMAGYGNYRGNSALALGVAHYKNESTMFHGGISWAGGSSHMMANAGVTWKIGNRDSEGAVADRYRKGPISSTYAMQTEVASMKAQNAGLKGEVSDLKAENEQIKAQNAGLQNEVDQLKAQMAAMMARLGM